MAKRIELTGWVEGVYRAESPETLVSQATPELEASLEGVVGDRHFGFSMRSGARTPHYPRGTVIRNSRQVSIVSVEELAIIQSRMDVPFLLPEWLGANLLIRGIPELTFLPPGTRLSFPYGTALIVAGENLPCNGPAQVLQAQFPDLPGVDKAFLKQALHLRGVVAWVERAGKICAGEQVWATLPEQRLYPGRG